MNDRELTTRRTRGLGWVVSAAMVAIFGVVFASGSFYVVDTGQARISMSHESMAALIVSRSSVARGQGLFLVQFQQPLQGNTFFWPRAMTW